MKARGTNFAKKEPENDTDTDKFCSVWVFNRHFGLLIDRLAISKRRRTLLSTFKLNQIQIKSQPFESSLLLVKSTSTVSEVPGHEHLRSARCHQLSVPRVRRSTIGTRGFSVARPTIWNSLPDHLQDPAVDSGQFRRDLMTYLFAGHS